MRIELHQSGGVIAPARRVPWVVQLNDLPEADRANLKSLASEAERSVIPSAEPRPDDLRYKIVIHHDGGTMRTIQVAHSNMTDSLRRLIECIKTHAKTSTK